jgi:hypothetical protein
MTHLLHKFEEKYINLKGSQKKCKYYNWDFMIWSKVCITWGSKIHVFLIPNMVNKLCAYIRIAMKFTPSYDQCFWKKKKSYD